MGGLFDFPKKEREIRELENDVNSEGFWQDINKANMINKKLANLKKELEDFKSIQSQVIDALELLQSSNDDELTVLIKEDMDNWQKTIENLENDVFLNGEFDDYNCYLEIHPGAGGTESCDWASMLYRMYTRFAEKYGYNYEVVEEQKGEEAGIKSVTVKISGNKAYGYLKRENGVHRLVRISPFDSNKRRHTSFASVTVIPEINKDINIDINEADLKIDVYHSSGAGGQSVNTSNSAVRITHLPTKTVVTCQNERSQLKNKEQAMKLLKNKLYLLELEKQNAELDSLKDNSTSINFGSQIRSYVLEPYKLVKDNRNNYEDTDPEKILDGEILELIKSLLKVK